MRNNRWKPKEKTGLERGGTALTIPVDPSAILSPVGRCWDKQPGESDQEFYLFGLYRDQGVLRSIDEVKKYTPASLEYLHGLAKRCMWEERAKAFQAYIEGATRKILEKQILVDGTTARRVMGELISHVVNRLAQKLLIEDPTSETIDSLISRAKDMVIIQKALSSAKSDDAGGRSRTLNVMIGVGVKPAEAAPEPEVEYETVEIQANAG